MPSRSTLQKAIVCAFLFISGGAALVYELAWSRYLGNVLGNSGQAHAVVLATFMGGLALGAFIFGRAADRSKNPLRLYGFLELGIGAYALAFKPVLDALGRAYLSLAPAMPESTRLFAKLGLAGLALLPPTILMGGTLPPLVRHLTSQLSGVRRSLARLYAINSLGAAFGAFLAGVFMVPGFGLAASTRMAAIANAVIALCAIALSRAPVQKEAASDSDSVDDDAQESLVYPLRAIRVALIGSALSGFSAMVCQITWIRLLALVLGASTYAFTLILTAFILGIGVGSYWLSRAKSTDALRLFGLLQAGIAIAVCVALPLYVRMPLYLWRISDALAHSSATWSLYLGASFALCCLVLLIPTALMGASFPAVARVATAKASELGRQLGGVYLWNTAGTILGALLGGLVLMPAFTMEGAFAIAVSVNVIAALSAAWVAKPARWWLPGAVALGAAALFFAGASGWSELVANAGSFRDPGHPPASFGAYEAMMKRTYTTELHRDDTFATVVVGTTHPDGRRILRINGKVDASDGDDMDTQILLGQLGPLLHSGKAKTALVVGLGSGVTVGSLASHPELERIDVVEISPAVVEAARRFSYINGNALDDPRVHVHVDDARTFMLLQGLSYDVIVSEPSNPWVAGV
ncbi:MAG: spermidine synthase, partial [Myxococcaceae bacterium]